MLFINSMKIQPGEMPIIPLSDMTKGLSDDQEFTIIFDTSKAHYSVNNLVGTTPVGTTPRFGSEIYSEGVYKVSGETYSVLIRGILLREEIVPTPIFTGSEVYIVCSSGTDDSAELWVCGETSDDPGRIHSNSNIELVIGDVLDLKQGIVSSVGTITCTDSTIDTREGVPEEDVPDLDIEGNSDSIIDYRQANYLYHTLDPNTYYIAGYFEFDTVNTPPTYCVPHFLPAPDAAKDPNIVTSNFKPGIVYIDDPNFVPEDYIELCKLFYFGSPNPTDLCTVYDPNKIHFWEYDGTDPNDTSHPISCAIDMDIITDPNDASKTLMVLNLKEDLYIAPGTVNGFFATTHEAANNSDYGSLLDETRIVMDFKDYVIYGDKLYLGIPPMDVVPDPSKSGAIVSTETIDFLAAHSANLVVLSEGSIRMVVQPVSSEEFTLNGYLYAKDDLFIQTNNRGADIYFNFEGNMVCRDDILNNDTPGSPFAWYTRAGTSDTSMCVNLGDDTSIHIFQKDDAIKKIVDLRKEDFKVRKKIL